MSRAPIRGSHFGTEKNKNTGVNDDTDDGHVPFRSLGRLSQWAIMRSAEELTVEMECSHLYALVIRSIQGLWKSVGVGGWWEQIYLCLCLLNAVQQRNTCDFNFCY